MLVRRQLWRRRSLQHALIPVPLSVPFSTRAGCGRDRPCRTVRETRHAHDGREACGTGQTSGQRKGRAGPSDMPITASRTVSSELRWRWACLLFSGGGMWRGSRDPAGCPALDARRPVGRRLASRGPDARRHLARHEHRLRTLRGLPNATSAGIRSSHRCGDGVCEVEQTA